MDFTTALIIPGVLTVLSVILTWIYLRKSVEIASRDYSNIITTTTRRCQKTDKREPPESVGDTETGQEEKENLTPEELRPYLIDSGDLEEAVRLNDDMIMKDMQEKGINNLQTYYKASRLKIKEMEKSLSTDEKEKEREAQRKQLEEIFHLMAAQKDKFGVDSYNDVEDQMKLYSQE
ncbi:predicted protein [Nematostella vectensis]|uniref:Matrix-remodeling-associated protein 7 helical domain-containing protein n=1 Tax=Nematostella vectensis TaxID=45351 RepID=A7RUG3_NEMVE|nr:matrix-remodeling-associated protein 7 [Nematostella vectensis]EDO44897.1 predicted protein [Nematostella vectensis]|eukprot:XP_001636960.1 predicted protein [Nematostella vectensis]